MKRTEGKIEATLLLEDGKIFKGKGFGSQGTSIAEVVFHTGMTGYQEIFTDPSYKGQMVLMTYPHIGNYGFNNEDFESTQPHIAALIVKEACKIPSNHRSTETLDSFLHKYNIIGMEDIDTRALTRHIREKGSLKAIISNTEHDIPTLKKLLDKHPPIQDIDLVSQVTIDKPYTWKQKADSKWYYENIISSNKESFRVITFDFGIKQNILKLMSSLNIQVELVPASTPAESIIDMNPDGIFLSNGPGDPQRVSYAVKNIKELMAKFPMFGICLGHQIMALALGGTTFKLKFGHHGSNHPVKDLQSGKIEITSQNHNYAVEPKSLEKIGFEISHINLNDNTVEGMVHRELPVYSVQYHPEASPGPHDSVNLFKKFYSILEENS
ncbi:MAG: glutamine-hydrolyzing carbamoyl-phosphate synthase small subunit [bacterium]